MNNWTIKIANMDDIGRWLAFVKNVAHDFYDIDLPNDENYRSAIIKNIKRKTAIYVEESDKIIGGTIYSPNSNRIGWLAVDPMYRRRGIGTALVNRVCP
jgi:predicted GNAT family acetyltransferase